MQTLNFTQSDYTENRQYYQFKLPLDIDCIIPADDSVRLLSLFIDEMDLEELYQTYFRRTRKNQATPRQMLKILLYAYMCRTYSSRDIESLCRRDINFMFLLEGAAAPDHATIARFRSLHFAPCAKRIMSQITGFLKETGEISADNVFIDGTKIEACANKYSFVWKKSVTKNLKRRMEKICTFVEECEVMYGLAVTYNNKISIRTLKRLRRKLMAMKKAEGITFVHGIGRRKGALQKSVEQLDEHLEKLKDYTKKLHTCGRRNSYSKTDPDATFMRMKEDAMLNGQLKPAYNLQHAVDSEYIVWLSLFTNPTDTRTLIPMLEEMKEELGFKYNKVTADAGYESEENYLYLEENGQLSFIKPMNYEISKTRKYKSDISRRENMEYNEEADSYTCRNGRQLNAVKERKLKSSAGFPITTTVYSCEDCGGCEYKLQCIKGNNSKTPMEQRNKVLQVSKKMIQKRQEDLERILSDEGCQLRMNRSIQVEGSFAEIKENMGFRRYMCRGRQNVLAESMLLALAHNINKLHSKIQSGNTGRHLFDPAIA